MNRYHFTIVFALIINLVSYTCTAQWTTVYQDSEAIFYDAAFPSDNVGYVAASDTGGRVVLRTIDGGTTWNKKYIPDWSHIDKIVMSDSITGYLIKGGVPGKILKTNDGFTTYTTHTIDTSFIVQAIALLNDSTGLYLNNAARLRKFENNGSSFSHVIDTLVDGQNLQFVNSSVGYMDTGYGLLETSDAGATWNFVNSDLGFFCVEFNFVDVLNGYFSDVTAIFKTTDGGITFSEPYDFPNVYSFAVRDNFCMAANDSGDVAYTNDGGLTWQTENTGINLIAQEPYEVITTPGGYCFLFSQFCGEIKKREPIQVGIKESTNNSNISVYPNPASIEITIHSNKVFENATLCIYNGLGQKVKQINDISGHTFTAQRDTLPSGLYFIRLTQDDKLVFIDQITFLD